MTKNKIQFTNNQNGTWTVFNQRNGKCADIVKIGRGFGIGGEKDSKKYRVDVNGRTVDSLIDHFQTAKKIAYFHVNKKGEI